MRRLCISIPCHKALGVGHRMSMIYFSSTHHRLQSNHDQKFGDIVISWIDSNKVFELVLLVVSRPIDHTNTKSNTTWLNRIRPAPTAAPNRSPTAAWCRDRSPLSRALPN